LTYKTTGFYSPPDERTIGMGRSDLRIDWQLDAPPILRKKTNSVSVFATRKFFE